MNKKLFIKCMYLLYNSKFIITSRRDGGRGREIELTGGLTEWDTDFGVDCWLSLTSKNKSPRSK